MDCSGSPNESYSTNWFRDCLETQKIMGQIQQSFWNKWIPKKHNVFIWRLVKNRIPTRRNLSNMGIDIPCTVCPLCETKEKDISHLFADCPVSAKMWARFGDWWEIEIPAFQWIYDPLTWSWFVIKNRKAGV